MRPLSKAPASYVTSPFIHTAPLAYRKKKNTLVVDMWTIRLMFMLYWSLSFIPQQKKLEVHNISLDKRMENDQILTYNKVPTPQNCGLYKYHTLYPHLKDLLPSYFQWCNRQRGTLRHLLFVSVVKKSIWIALHIWEDRHFNCLVTMTNYKEWL